MAISRIYEGEEPQRVNKWLAQAGVCSRREAEALITEGLVSIDGEKISDPGRKIQKGQTLTLSDRASRELKSQISVVLNKPVGYVSGQPEGEQIPAVRLVRRDTLWGAATTIPGSKTSLAPLGRLDQDSRGLLLLSEDGVLAKAVIGPDSLIDKEYLVTVEGRVDRSKLQLLRQGLELDGRKLKPARVTIENTQVLRFVLVEGRNRQIRRMCEAVDLLVTDLVRIRIGPVNVGSLPEGCWRPLSPDEREGILRAAGVGPTSQTGDKS